MQMRQFNSELRVRSFADCEAYAASVTPFKGTPRYPLHTLRHKHMYMYKRGGSWACCLHDTNCVEVRPDNLVFVTYGEWDTPTTRTFLQALKLPVGYSKKNTHFHTAQGYIPLRGGIVVRWEHEDWQLVACDYEFVQRTVNRRRAKEVREELASVIAWAKTVASVGGGKDEGLLAANLPYPYREAMCFMAHHTFLEGEFTAAMLRSALEDAPFKGRFTYRTVVTERMK